MDAESLIEKGRHLQNEIDKVGPRRASWDSSTKSTITGVLKNIEKSPSGLKCFVREGEGFVKIQLEKRPIKIGASSAILDGAYLVYSQEFSGRISVFIQFPYAENFVTRAKQIYLGTFEPEHITKDLITENVWRFLGEMLLWETRSSYAQAEVQFQNKESDII